MLHALVNAPSPEVDLLGAFARWLDRRDLAPGRYLQAAGVFLRRWPDPHGWAAEPLEVRLAARWQVRPLLNFLMLHGHLRPGYDWLLERRLGAVGRDIADSPLAGDFNAFVSGDGELGFTALTTNVIAKQIVTRMLIQTGRPLGAWNDSDYEAFEAAVEAREARTGQRGKHFLDLTPAVRTVVWHLGNPTPPAPRRNARIGWNWDGQLAGTPAAIVPSLLAYLECASATRTANTTMHIAYRLGAFGRHLAAVDPDLASLADLDRQRHIEPYLAALPKTISRRSHKPLAASERRSRVLTLGRMIDDINEWGWKEAPGRKLVFARDVPKLPRALPRYVTPDRDRQLRDALEKSPNRLRADALLLLRATGMRIGELCDLELDCVHEVPGQGAWLKVPLGKLDTERMVPLDDETLTVLDRIAAARSPGRPLPHPTDGRLVDFLLVHHGRRISKTALRGELARVCDEIGVDAATPHQLRHTYATALVNAGCSLQALMALLGHSTAEMSLRYGRLFDQTVRADYERALAIAKERYGNVLPATAPTHVDGDWRQTPLVKARLAGGYCLRTAAQGTCPYTNICEHCPSYRTDTAFLPVLTAQRADADILAADAEARGWNDEAERHRRLAARIDQLIAQAEADQPTVTPVTLLPTRKASSSRRPARSKGRA